MRTISQAALKKLMADGRVEATTDVNQFGRQEIRWIRTGARETIKVNKLASSFITAGGMGDPTEALIKRIHKIYTLAERHAPPVGFTKLLNGLFMEGDAQPGYDLPHISSFDELIQTGRGKWQKDLIVSGEEVGQIQVREQRTNTMGFMTGGRPGPTLFDASVSKWEGPVPEDMLNDPNIKSKSCQTQEEAVAFINQAIGELWPGGVIFESWQDDEARTALADEGAAKAAERVGWLQHIELHHAFPPISEEEKMDLQVEGFVSVDGEEVHLTSLGELEIDPDAKPVPFDEYENDPVHGRRQNESVERLVKQLIEGQP